MDELQDHLVRWHGFAIRIPRRFEHIEFKVGKNGGRQHLEDRKSQTGMIGLESTPQAPLPVSQGQLSPTEGFQEGWLQSGHSCPTDKGRKKEKQATRIMFGSPRAGDWAADEEDASPLPTPAPVQSSSPPRAARAAAPQSQDVRATSSGGGNNSGSGRFDRDRDNARSGGRFDRDRDNGGGRFDRDRDNGGSRFDRRDNGGGGRFDRGDNGGGRFDRGDSGGGRFDRGGGRFEREGGRFEREGGRFEREGGRFERDGGRSEGADSGGRWGRNAERRDDYGDRRGGREHTQMPVERGFVVSIKENFGFVSCMEREGDLFFHITEAPVDVQLQDEVEFRVKYNQRSDKEMACQLVGLPKGTIVVEDVSEEFFDGVVTKSLPRGGNNSYNSYNRDDTRHSQRDEPHGLIEAVTPEENEGQDDSQEAEGDEAAKEQPEEQDAGEEQKAAEDSASPKKSLPKREFVRFNSSSFGATDSKADGEEQQQGSGGHKGRSRKSATPHFGDEVRFRIAKHRKTGAKRAVEITVTVSARDKLEKEIEAKLATMTRENGVVAQMKGGGGFIKCCDRPEDVYFPFHEIREAPKPAKDQESDGKETKQAETGDKARRPSHGRQGKDAGSLREGDEVSFFVYEDQEDDSSRSRPHLTALRVQKLPAGTVSFEELVRSDVEGLVSKLPKEPRNGPEVIGAITPTTLPASAPATTDEKPEASKDATAPSETTDADDTKPSKKKKSGNGAKAKVKKAKVIKAEKVSFRLCDTEDMSYVPHIGDQVAFDEVMDKRTGKLKAVKVRVVQLNPKNRETGMINAMKEDFGFIKCAERAGDAYFRFSDVMGSNRNFRSGTEVAFDVLADNKADHMRATRLVILPQGTIKWEDVVAEGLEGEIIAVPSSRRGSSNRGGGRGEKGKQLQRSTHGKVRFVTPEKQHLVDFLPHLKEKVDTAFLTSKTIIEKPQTEETEETKDETTGEETPAKESKEAKNKEIRVAFPSSLSNFEREALHEYSDWLGLNHESIGEGSSRHLELFAAQKISIKTVKEKLEASPPQLTVEFKADDVDDVRYEPRVGDRIKLNLVLLKRTKQFQCKAITCVEAAAKKTAAKDVEAKAGGGSADTKGEGFITVVKHEGFGFIQPVMTASGVVEENLFFHVKEITTGQTLEELKEGTEVQYTMSFDETRKKMRAVAIAVLPAGTIKTVVVKSVKGIVTRPSFLSRMKGGAKARFTKTSASSVGRIRLIPATKDGDDGDAGSDADVGTGEEEDEEAEDSTAEGGDEENVAAVSAPGGAKKADKKAVARKVSDNTYSYNIRDVVDQTAILREGDVVEFLPQSTPKNLRATKIRLLVSHAIQGVVTRVMEDFGGLIRIDGDENEPVEARFSARNVLRGDILSEGDRVEFAYKPPSASPSIKNMSARTSTTEDKAEKKAEEQEDKEEKVETDTAAAAEPVLGHATSVLRLSSAPTSSSDDVRRGSRMVNSTLKEAMRQIGANAMTASRMAKGPDGTRGFPEGWQSAPEEESTDATTTEVTSATSIATESTTATETETTTTSTTTTTTVTTSTTTEESEA
ncbi:hypothetical protein BBJ28_00015297 [Nothophytophthora sp. Chile5]|nr:hypothetical protein BBJ28_00015297 [Nothophytophthora sp. Chile5]